MYLTGFTSSPSLGPAWGVNVWYKYKYVNSKTGAYGKASPWTQLPIFSGSTNLPCTPTSSKSENKSENLKESLCPNLQFSGQDSCKSNLPRLAIDNPAYPVGSDDYINVHRYVTPLTVVIPPDDSIDGVIVGMMFSNGGTATFADTSSSPCKESSCSNIAGC
jgi:hypothetical protein